MEFRSPEDFISRWIIGLADRIQERQGKGQEQRYSSERKRTEDILPEMLQDSLLKDYIFLFLERNFYRNFKERVRSKPDESLWQVWFGSEPLVWGLLISPTRRFGEWTNDKSMMRRESYSYWTIGHVLQAGLIVPTRELPVPFHSAEEFFTFYETVLARLSVSKYEQEISARYLDYVRAAACPEELPLLIPELRYAGKEAKHRYRLDFSVLNPYSMKMIGFEISPASSHISVSKIAEKTQKKVNEGLAVSWGKETAKRNEYFEKFGIITYTFSDNDLADIDRCWGKIVEALSERPSDHVTVAGAEDYLRKVYAQIRQT
tara:strand:- start:302 stop:1255 length:954 start_codon:yes stop_codon:yes gene_type:complete